MKILLSLLSAVIFLGCQTTEPQKTEEEKPKTQEIQKAIQQELSVSQPLTATILEGTEYHARGKIEFTDEPVGGLFLAVKTESGWIIPYHGNGAIDCEALKKYQFPPAMVPECVLEEPSYTFTNTMEESCTKDSDCEIPPRYAVRSSCPYTTRCFQNQCAVICPIPDDAPTTKGESETGSAQFSGKLESVHPGCFVDGECYIMVDGKHITAIRGWAQETVGSVKGVEGFGDLESHIGSTLEIYAKDLGNGNYTLYGDEAYYIWLK